VSDERLAELLERLAKERAEADRRYNDALTALDRELQPEPTLPHPPTGYDTEKLPALNEAWNILPADAPPLDRSIKGRMRAFVWRLVGPALETQRHFNATLVEHLNRNVESHQASRESITTTIAMLGQQAERLTRFQGLLIQYLQTITLYIDTRDRSVSAEARALRGLLDAIGEDWLKRWDSLAAREARFTNQLASLDDLRTSVALAQQTALTLKREVERYLASGPGPGAAYAPGVATSSPAPAPVAAADLDAFKYLGFEEAFRGSEDAIRSRLASYVPYFEGQTDVLDIGCGRGQFLDLLRQNGIPAWGIDLNHEMVEVSRARGLDVTEGDALGLLGTLADNSLGGIFASQVVEHLPPPYLMRLLETAMHKVRPGGLVILETINPACWLAFFESFIRDVTHVWPLHPDTLQYLLRVSGFQRVTIEFRSPVAESARLQPVPAHAALDASLRDLVSSFNENVEKLNARLFTFQDYAAIARK